MFNAAERATSGGGWEKQRTESYCISVNAPQVELWHVVFLALEGIRGLF